MSAWAAFLTEIANETEVTLVGPLYHQHHVPLMPTIYVDGGSRFRNEGGWAAPHPATGIPTISVGDGDSAAGSLDELLPTVKDYSDLAFALRSLPAAVEDVTLLGFLGGRRDHELANLGEVNAFLRGRSHYTRVDLVGNSGDRIVAFANGELTLDIRGVFSVFTFELADLRVGGACRYVVGPAQTLPPFSSVGLSNEGSGRVQFETDRPCFVYVAL